RFPIDIFSKLPLIAVLAFAKNPGNFKPSNDRRIIFDINGGCVSGVSEDASGGPAEWVCQKNPVRVFQRQHFRSPSASKQSDRRRLTQLESRASHARRPVVCRQKTAALTMGGSFF